MYRKSILLLTLVTMVLASACTPASAFNVAWSIPVAPIATRRTLIVFAAASLTEAFNELGESFESERPDVKVVINFAGSQQLAHQLAQGAPADIFASANQAQMQTAIQASRVSKEGVAVFCGNHLVVVFPDENPADLSKLADLTKPGLKLGLAASAVPVGKYSLEFLERASQDTAFGSSYKADVLRNVVSYEQTVKALLSKAVLGEVDAGIVYTSDISGLKASIVGKIVIPETLNPLARYYIAPISDSQQPDLNKAFLAYVLSPPGQEILAKHGLIPMWNHR